MAHQLTLCLAPVEGAQQGTEEPTEHTPDGRCVFEAVRALNTDNPKTFLGPISHKPGGTVIQAEKPAIEFTIEQTSEQYRRWCVTMTSTASP
jgi:hypothetical protein